MVCLIVRKRPVTIVLPATVLPGRTEDEDWADLSSGLLRKNEWNQNDVAPITTDRTRRLGDCSRDLRAPDPLWESCTRCPRRPGPHGSDPRRHVRRTAGRSDPVERP